MFENPQEAKSSPREILETLLPMKKPTDLIDGFDTIKAEDLEITRPLSDKKIGLFIKGKKNQSILGFFQAKPEDKPVKTPIDHEAMINYLKDWEHLGNLIKKLNLKETDIDNVILFIGSLLIPTSDVRFVIDNLKNLVNLPDKKIREINIETTGSSIIREPRSQKILIRPIEIGDTTLGFNKKNRIQEIDITKLE
jgi:hypothetical protein